MLQRPCDGQYLFVLHKVGQVSFHNVELFYKWIYLLMSLNWRFCMSIWHFVVILFALSGSFPLTEPFSAVVMDAGTIYSLLQMLLVKPEHRLSGHRKAENACQRLGNGAFIRSCWLTAWSEGTGNINMN